jgi:hypothetical protein
VVIIVQSVLVSRLLEKLITLCFPHRRLFKPHFIDDSKIEHYCKGGGPTIVQPLLTTAKLAKQLRAGNGSRRVGSYHGKAQ